MASAGPAAGLGVSTATVPAVSDKRLLYITLIIVRWVCVMAGAESTHVDRPQGLSVVRAT